MSDLLEWSPLQARRCLTHSIPALLIDNGAVDAGSPAASSRN